MFLWTGLVFFPGYSSSDGSTPVKPVAERKVDSNPVVSPVIRHLTEVPVIHEILTMDSKKKKKKKACVL